MHECRRACIPTISVYNFFSHRLIECRSHDSNRPYTIMNISVCRIRFPKDVPWYLKIRENLQSENNLEKYT